MSYALATLVIKAGVALIASLVYRRFGKKHGTKGALAAMLVSGILAEAFMILGYFFYEAVIMGAGIGAAGGILGNVGQGTAGVIVACVVAPALMRSHEVTELMNRS